jgi:hypothetical protein
MSEGTWLLFDRKELGENQYGKYLLVHDMDKSKHFIDNTKLWEVFETATQGQPFLLTIEGKKVTAVQDVKNEILRTATVKVIRKLIELDEGSRLRSQAVSYSKDLVCAGKVELDKLLENAWVLTNFIKDGKADVTGSEGTDD